MCITQKSPVINTPLRRGGGMRSVDLNRFSGFPLPVETAEAVKSPRWRSNTLLKQGVNEIRVVVTKEVLPSEGLCHE